MNKKLYCPCCGRKYNLKSLRQRREELWEEYVEVNEALSKEIEKTKKKALAKFNNNERKKNV